MYEWVAHEWGSGTLSASVQCFCTLMSVSVQSDRQAMADIPGTNPSFVVHCYPMKSTRWMIHPSSSDNTQNEFKHSIKANEPDCMRVQDCMRVHVYILLLIKLCPSCYYPVKADLVIPVISSFCHVVQWTCWSCTSTVRVDSTLQGESFQYVTKIYTRSLLQCIYLWTSLFYYTLIMELLGVNLFLINQWQ